MTLESILKAVAAILVPLLTLVGFVSRKRRLRTDIKENLDLLDLLAKHEALHVRTPTSTWLQGRIALDVAKLSGQQLGTPKKPINKGSVVFAAILALGFGLWTFVTVRHGFVWYSVFPGLVSALMVISLLGMFTNRDLPPGSEPQLPEGASPLRPRTQAELLASLDQPVVEIELDDRFAAGGQVDVAFRFLRNMREGHITQAIGLADENWLLCRIQSWIWANRSEFGEDVTAWDALATSLLKEQRPDDLWARFTDSERQIFSDVWREIDPDKMGAASARRRIARNYELVILAPVGTTGGYFVSGPATVANALPFVMHFEGAWKVASHLGIAPPVPGWPPAWWVSGDTAVDALPPPPPPSPGGPVTAE